MFVTTSFFERQVQSELIADGHPVLLVSGGDIARLLIAKDLASDESVGGWLRAVKAHATGMVK